MQLQPFKIETISITLEKFPLALLVITCPHPTTHPYPEATIRLIFPIIDYLGLLLEFSVNKVT